MVLNSKANNRIAIYVFHDSDKIVDKYVPTFLNELRKYVKYLLVVINGEINEEGKNCIQEVCDDILIRPNKGYDITGYKEGIEHIGWDNISEFDECIFVNSTLYGPIFPFKDMFLEMDKRDIDFWGITKHHKVDYDAFGTCKYGYIPEHIQSSFLVIRKSMNSSSKYREVWDTLPEINSYGEAIGFFEVIFTKESEEKGFKSDVYINTDYLEGFTRYPLMMMSDELVINKRCPVIKQKSFFQNYFDILTDTFGNATVDVFDYIQNYTNYDVDLIWDNILRISNMADIKAIMHLNYILPKNHTINKDNKIKSKMALIMHLYYPDLIDESLKYACNIPKDADLIITTPREDVKKIIEDKIKNIECNKKEIILVSNKGRDVSALLVGCKEYVNNYDVICFVHDKKTTQTLPYANGSSFSYKCFECNLASQEYVLNIIETFANNPRLGMLMPPVPSHGNFYQIIGNEWTSNYENTLSLAHRLGIKTNIYWEKEPITPLGTMFWFRPKALKTLFEYDWQYNDFPSEPNSFDGTILHAIERIYGFVVQNEGYYPAWVMPDKLASIEFGNLHFMLRETNKKLFSKYYTSNLLDMTQKMETNMYFKWNKISLKICLKKICPKFIWNFAKKTYHFLRNINKL